MPTLVRLRHTWPLMVMLALNAGAYGASPDDYKARSRFTDPKERDSALQGIPADANKLCEAVKRLTIHHNLSPYFEIPKGSWDEMPKVWPPRMRDLIESSVDPKTGRLYED